MKFILLRKWKGNFPHDSCGKKQVFLFPLRRKRERFSSLFSKRKTRPSLLFQKRTCCPFFKNWKILVSRPAIEYVLLIYEMEEMIFLSSKKKWQTFFFTEKKIRTVSCFFCFSISCSFFKKWDSLFSRKRDKVFHNQERSDFLLQRKKL